MITLQSVLMLPCVKVLYHKIADNYLIRGFYTSLQSNVIWSECFVLKCCLRVHQFHEYVFPFLQWTSTQCVRRIRLLLLSTLSTVLSITIAPSKSRHLESRTCRNANTLTFFRLVPTHVNRLHRLLEVVAEGKKPKRHVKHFIYSRTFHLESFEMQ